MKVDTTTSIETAAGILAVWYASATLAAWQLSHVLRRNQFESVEVSCLLMMAGSLLTVFSFFTDSSFYNKFLSALKNQSMYQVALLHYMGTIAMCMAQTKGGASLTMVKSIEPGLTAVFCWMMSEACFGSRKLLGTVLISSGVAVVSVSGDGNLDGSGVVYALISAFCFPLRNILSYKSDDNFTSTQRLGMVSSCACIPALLFCGMKWLTHGNAVYNLPMGRLTVATIAHLGYNVASFAFLSSYNPMLHSVANLFKRLVVVVFMFAVDEKVPSSFVIPGLCLLSYGIVLYSEVKVACKAYVGWIMPLLIAITSLALLSGNVLLHLGIEPRAFSRAVPLRYSSANLLSCIASIRRRHLDELKDIFRQPQFQDRPILLVDPAQHFNLGDPLLVLGEKEFLVALGWGEQSVHECGVAQAKVAPRCPAVLNASAPGTYKLALWQAGGNWGNLWKGIQKQRVQSMGYLLDAQLTVVSMPQSMHYEDGQGDAAAIHDARTIQAAAARIGGANESRKRLIFLWRQTNSYEEAERLYPFADNRLVPDIAFWCGPFLHHGTVKGLDRELVDLLLFLRTDKESVFGGKDSDFYKNPDKLRGMVAEAGGNLSFRVADWGGSRYLRAIDAAEYKPKIEAAVRLLNTGRVVIADRLHATILSMLSLKPVFYVDQSYGKIRRTLDVAFASSDACRDEGAVRVFRTASLTEAISRAGRFVAGCKASGECP